jgi:hypothetical protein
MKIHVCISSDPSSEHYGQYKNFIKLLMSITVHSYTKPTRNGNVATHLPNLATHLPNLANHLPNE